ncbi:ATP-dependent DNA helicase Q-like 3 [Durio zibethinus]|uniref:ATP-dependent DNA helicase Q-like 3 n=1 Tax=Durio zibethinus TaxID=66656 RepID=A0A6P5YNM0_DURZI|nr:ATP-dependent DNA helicase Q-like 3 [Durio zibethinus]
MQQTPEYVNEIHIPFTVDISVMKSGNRKIATITPHSSRYLNPQKVDFEASSTFLENESFKKNGKSGKSFYYLQVASTVRWLSTTSSAEITNRIRIITTSPSENIT